ncbi:MAG: penicillin-binding protein 2 [Thermodesulfobacteriota bacterium]
MKARGKEQSEEKRFAGRVALLGAFFILFFGVVAARAVHLQVVIRSFLSQKAENQYTRNLGLVSRRGVIYDAMHREFAITLDVMEVAVRPRKVKDKEAAAAELARCLELPPAEVKSKLDGSRAFVYLKRDASLVQASRVKELNIPGVDLAPSTRRIYPQRNLAAQVVGFCGVDGHGMEGLEFRYDSQLAGEGSQWTVLRDALGRSIAEAADGPRMQGGNNLVLTLDQTIQGLAEQALAAQVEKYRAQGGMVVVMNPRTGGILAMANVPLTNPNDYGSFEKSLWRNRTVTDAYEPGSVMKVFMAAAALESGLVRPDTIFDCEMGSYRVGRNVVHDVHPHGVLNLGDIVKYSSNIGALKVTRTIGKQTFYQTLRSFGFGGRLGIDLPGESPGGLSDCARWRDIDFATISFGQGVSVSALQLASAVSAIANGGALMRPHLVQAITDSSGKVVKSFEPEVMSRPVSPETARTTAQLMTAVVLPGGTGTQAALDGYTCCGKTGTAQKVSETGGYAKGRYIAAFVGFAPVEDPVLTIVVLVDEPRGAMYGGVVSAPAFRAIAQKALQYYNIPPRVETPGISTCSAGDGRA